MAEPLIGDMYLDGMCVERGGVPAVAGVTCTIASRQWLGVVGANGSGKTTLLRAVAGRLPISAGRVTIGGVDRTVDRAWRARRIGFAPDCDALPGALCGAELFGILDDGAFGTAAADGLRPLR